MLVKQKKFTPSAKNKVLVILHVSFVRTKAQDKRSSLTSSNLKKRSLVLVNSQKFTFQEIIKFYIMYLYLPIIYTFLYVCLLFGKNFVYYVTIALIKYDSSRSQ